MRRSTAAAVGTLTGAALIVGVRLSVSAPVVPTAAPPAVDLANFEPYVHLCRLVHLQGDSSAH